jgi:hypothetical protein
MREEFLPFYLYRMLPFLAVAVFDCVNLFAVGDTINWTTWERGTWLASSILFPAATLLWGGHYVRTWTPRSRFGAGAILLSFLVIATNPFLNVLKGCYDLALHRGACT